MMDMETSVVNNHVYLYSEISSSGMMRFNSELKRLELDHLSTAARMDSEPSPIYMHICSPGGELYSGFAAADFIRSLRVPTVSIIEGYAMSAATLISTAAKKRQMHKHATMLIHQLSTVVWGKHSEIKEQIKNLDKDMETIKSWYLERTSLKSAALADLLKHDIHLSANECLTYGLIDEVI